MLKFRPLFNNILVKQVQEKSGIILPETENNNPIRAEIVSVGSGEKDTPMLLFPGQFVYFIKNHAHPIKSISKNHYVLSQKAVLVVEDESNLS
jgi:co-chaperonin GroES (HSP10)